MREVSRSTRAVVAALALGVAAPLVALGLSGGAAVGARSATIGPATAAPSVATASGRTHVSAARCARNRAAGPMTFVSPFSYDASAGIIDVVAAQQLGYFRDLCVTVKFVMNSYTPNQLVSAGAGTVTGEGSAADDLVLVANGANLVAIATFGDTSDYALLTQSSITKLTQLEGKTVAYHTTMPVIITEMLKKAGVDVSKLNEVNDISYNPDLLPEGKFAALQAYRSNEPITLRAEHQGFREYIPSQFGVHGTFNLQVVNRTYLARHRATVADFLRAELHAFDFCGVHPLTCVKFEDAAAAAAGVKNNQAHDVAEWKFEYALAVRHTLPGAGVGVQSQAEWAPEVAALKASGLVTHVPPLSTYEDTALAASLYHGKSLVWPGP
ncbi:MAG TPA: ABC transporter substrate-binding protein [Acidimicrobiales bacterium]|nr:ABC transporter substrate-binding protein [Acidimicrobiales bacterium]